MIDKFLYKFFCWLDDAISFVETYVLKFSNWIWHFRVKLVKKKRKKK
jgi:hypothetical protein